MRRDRGAIAQFESEICAERQMDGIQNAEARGVQFGRKKQLSQAQCAELRQKWAEGIMSKPL